MILEKWWSYVTECWVCYKPIKPWEQRYVDGIKHYHLDCKMEEGKSVTKT